MAANHAPLHIRSPLLYSSSLSSKLGAHVYLKLENTQPSGSFKNRGIGHLAQRSVAAKGPEHTHLIISSGGNAGFACAYAALALGTKCTVFVPVTANQRVIDRLEGMGANVVQGGAHWAEADAAARQRLAQIEGGVYLPPFDDPDVVDGHATMIAELTEQLAEQRATPVVALMASVGGGGLLAGLLKGMEQSGGRLNCPVVACETAGAASLAASLRESYAAGVASLVRLDAIETIASSLGATQVSAECLERALAHGRQAGLVSVVLQDRRAVDVVRKFTDDHAFFVEPACAASLTPVYSRSIFRAALPSVRLCQPGQKLAADAPSVVVVVCGGNTMTLDGFAQWEAQFANQGLGEVTVLVNGQESVVE